MDRELDLLDRGPARFDVPLEVLDLVRSGAEVTGVVAYDQVFERKANPGPPPVPLAHLFGQQDAYRRTVERQLRSYTRDDQVLLWSALEKEVSQGFGVVHLTLPAPDPCRPDVFVKRFPVAQVKWDSPTWEEKTRPCDDGTACGVNSALQMLSHVDCNTLDCFAESAACFMQRARSRGYSGGFACVVFDHDQAYRRVKRSRRFRCLTPVVSPGGVVTVGDEQQHVPAGQVVYLEALRLLFGEGGAVAAYCLTARIVAMVIAKVLHLPLGDYIDDFNAMLLAADSTAVDDLWEFLVDVLRFCLQ